MLKRGIEAAVIIAGAKRYADYVRIERIDPRFVKQAVTWLNQESWTENHEAAASRDMTEGEIAG